jgi:Ras family protein A
VSRHFLVLPRDGKRTAPTIIHPTPNPKELYWSPWDKPPRPGQYVDWYGNLVKDAQNLGDNTDYPAGHVTWLSKSAADAVQKSKISQTPPDPGYIKSGGHGLAAAIRRKLVMVGDGACGKTCTIVTFSKGTFPEVYVPTVFTNYVADVEVDSKHVELALWDTAGQEDYDRLRPLSYPDSHVIIISFSIDSPNSLANVREKWISEVMHFCAGLPIVVTGFKHDLRSDEKTIDVLDWHDMKPVSYSQGLLVAKAIGAVAYVECSAKTAAGLRSLFETATRLGLGILKRVNQASRARHRREGDCNLQ